MKSVSQALVNAIAAGERVVRNRVTIDWDNDGGTDAIDDMSHKIGNVTVDQSLESSVPQQVRIVPGAAVAQLDMTIARGNTTRYDIAAGYRSIATNSSGSTPSRNVTVNRPSGALPGELVLVVVAAINGTNALSLLANANVSWATLAVRGDGTDVFNNRVEGQCYIRRVTADEPPYYTFSLGDSQPWIAAAIRIGDPGLMGVHAVSSKGQDDDVTTYPILNGTPITTQLPNCTIVSIFAACAPVTGAAWSPLDGDTERADVTTTNGVDQATLAVMTVDNVTPGTYTKRATLNIGASVTSGIVFTIAFAPRLAGDEYQHAAWTFSELNPSSPYAGKERFGRRTQWKVGLHTEAGLEEVQVFTGLSTIGDGSSRSRTMEITALDNRETLRNTYGTFKVLVAESPLTLDGFNAPPLPLYPGLETTWIISYELAYAFINRGNLGIYDPTKQGPYGGYGYFASPPLRPYGSNMFWAPMHGSMEAFEGQAWWAYTQLPNTTRRRVRFTVGPFVAATEPAPAGGGVVTAVWAALASGATTFTTQKQILGRLELWGRFFNNTGSIEYWVVDLPTPITMQIKLTISSNGQMVANLVMPGGISRTINGPTVPTDGAWHFYGLHIDSPSGTALFRIDNTTTTVLFAMWANASVSSPQVWTKYVGNSGAQVAEMQLHGGTTDGLLSIPLAVNVVTLVTPWLNENFVPTAYIDKSENELDVFPFVDPTTDVWTLLSAIADTEFAAVYFDGDGLPHYRNTRSDVNTVGQTVQKLLTARVNMKDLQYSSELSQIANIVNVGYSPHSFMLGQVAWQAQGAVRIPALQTLTFAIQMPGLVLAVDGFNAFEGNSAPDGTGLVISPSDFTWSANSIGLYQILVTIENLGPQDAYLVDATGQPTPQLTASWVAPSSTTVAPVQNVDSDSVRRFREQPLDVSATVWRQRAAVAAMWAQFLVSELSTPSPVIRNFPIVGDPRVQLGDMDTLQDANGLGVNGQFRVTAIKHEGTPGGGYGQSLTVRQASKVALWNINNWDDGTVWGI